MLPSDILTNGIYCIKRDIKSHPYTLPCARPDITIQRVLQRVIGNPGNADSCKYEAVLDPVKRCIKCNFGCELWEIENSNTIRAVL